MKNNLKNQTSPYLLQHAENPVAWYPWCKEAFEKAKKEDKPVFLSIGYSTCHWCHVMAHESFEDESVAEILNKNFIAVKVDKEERPDIDSIYMSVCQAFTGSGGWPTSIFMTPDQKPFFAGTYFPKESSYNMIGFSDLLKLIHSKWENNREELLQSAQDVIEHLIPKSSQQDHIEEQLIEKAVSLFERSFDNLYGGFGNAPKFPSPHILIFLMDYYESVKDKNVLEMVETTLRRMYKGGIFDHIGYGFSRYSTDKFFLAPHFEKMLYDNALLIMSYAKAFTVTKNPFYKNTAEKTALYILREMTSPEGGFYSAQDADSDGIEGKYYLFEQDEILKILGTSKGSEFCKHYNITKKGNFEGKNIPNLLHSDIEEDLFDHELAKLYEYRKTRTKLHLDDKILTAWNGLMISAFAFLYKITGNETYLCASEKANRFIEENLCHEDSLFVSYRSGSLSNKGFLDDYAFYVFALLHLYEATWEEKYLKKAQTFCKKAITDFYDEENGGFYLYGKENEQLIIRPKEIYDGAMPSGNSVMAYNLVKLLHITKDDVIEKYTKSQLAFLSSQAKPYPAGHSFFLLALSMYLQSPEEIVVVLKDRSDLLSIKKNIHNNIHGEAIVKVLDTPTDQYPLINDKTTFYVCKNHTCMPPTNTL